MGTWQQDPGTRPPRKSGTCSGGPMLAVLMQQYARRPSVLIALGLDPGSDPLFCSSCQRESPGGSGKEG